MKKKNGLETQEQKIRLANQEKYTFKTYMIIWLKNRLGVRRDACEQFKMSVECGCFGEKKEWRDIKQGVEDMKAISLLLEVISHSTPLERIVGWPFCEPTIIGSPIEERLLLNHYQLEWLKDFLLHERKSELDYLEETRLNTRWTKNNKGERIDVNSSLSQFKVEEMESRCDIEIMDCLLETVNEIWRKKNMDWNEWDQTHGSPFPDIKADPKME
jgi:hypothetical protein